MGGVNAVQTSQPEAQHQLADTASYSDSILRLHKPKFKG